MKYQMPERWWLFHYPFENGPSAPSLSQVSFFLREREINHNDLLLSCLQGYSASNGLIYLVLITNSQPGLPSPLTHSTTSTALIFPWMRMEGQDSSLSSRVRVGSTSNWFSSFLNSSQVGVGSLYD